MINAISTDLYIHSMLQLLFAPGLYRYLLRGVEVSRPNQVWSTDITYIRLPKGFVYLVAVMDWYSRKVLNWRISNSMAASFCVDCLEEALRNFGKPEIFNSDQGSQFTSTDFTGVLKPEEIKISTDKRGRAFDNISWSGFGATSSTKMSTSKAMPRWASCCLA